MSEVVFRTDGHALFRGDVKIGVIFNAPEAEVIADLLNRHAAPKVHEDSEGRPWVRGSDGLYYYRDGGTGQTLAQIKEHSGTWGE